MADCIGLPDDVGLDTQNYMVKGITGYTTKLGAFLSHSYTANETPSLTNELTSKSYVDSQVGTKQNTINDGDLTIAKTSGLQTALNDKQDTIEDGDLTIANTNGLQSALDNKQDTIEDGDLTIANTDGLQSALNAKYDDTGGTISGSITITSDLVVGTTNIITEIDTKQDEITIDTDLTLNSIDVGDKYSYTSNLISKPIGLYGDTLHYYQVEDDLNTFINSVNEGDTILFPSGSITGNMVMNAVRSVKFIGLIEATTFLGTLDITAETDLDVNYLCRFENIIFTGLVSIAGTRRGHIFKNCSFIGGLSIAGQAITNLNLQFIDCIINTLNIADTFSANNDSTAIYGYALFMRCDFKDDPINSFTLYPYSIVLQDCIRIPDDHTSGNIFNYKLLGSATYEPGVFYIDYLDHIINKAHQYYVFDDDRFKILTIDTQLTSKYYVDAEVGTKQDEISAGTNISIVDNEVSCLLSAGTNISIVDGVISSSGGSGGTTIDSTTHLIVDRITTESTTKDCEIKGRLKTANEKIFINNSVKDLEGLTSYNLEIVSTFLSGDYISYNNGLFTFQNLTPTNATYLFMVTLVLSVESDAYEGRVNWRLTPFLNNNNFNGYGQFYTTTEGATAINRYSTLMVRTLVGARNGQEYRLALDCNKEGDNTFGSSMDGLRVRNASIFTFEYVGPN